MPEQEKLLPPANAMDFYTLEIKGFDLLLDGVKVKGINGYKLERSENNIPLLTLKLYIDPTIRMVKP